MGIKLLNPHVLVEPDPVVAALNGVLLPEQLQRKPGAGTVKRVGKFFFTTGAELELGIKEGDRVLFRAHDGEKVTVDDVDYVLLTMQQIIGILDDDEIS